MIYMLSLRGIFQLDHLKQKALLIGLFFLLAGPLYAQHHLKRACIVNSNTDIQISWDLYADPCAKFQEVLIFARQSVASPYVQIATITNIAQQNYTHVGAASLGNSWQYYIVYRFLCDDSEFLSDTLLLDISQPGISDLDSVSYDPVSGGVSMGWRKNPAPDLMGYIIYRNPVGEIDRVYNTLSYTDFGGTPLSSPGVYKLTAFDSCINQSVISPEHSFPFLSYTANTCGTRVTLNWTEYIGHPNIEYQLYTRINSADYVMDTILLWPQTSWTIDVVSGDQVEVFVRAILLNGATSRSNPVTFQAMDSFPVSANYISAVSWSAPDEFTLNALFDPSTDFDSVYLFYTTPNEANGKLVLEEDNLSASYPVVIPSLPETSVYRFQQVLVDYCSRRYYSNIASNVVLSGETTGTDAYDLNWNAVDYWDAPVQNQLINLGDDLSTYSTWNIYDDVYPDTFYTTTVLDEDLNVRCFQILTLEDGPNSHGLSAQVYSNPVCFIQEPSIFFPSAIVVRGLNNEFRPVGLSINKQASRIRIYSHTGQLVFSSDMNTYWNGKNGLESHYQDGVYMWMADVYFLDGSRKHYSGNLTVFY